MIRRFARASLAACLMIAAVAGSAKAEVHVDFLFGGGPAYYGHWGHHHCHGGWYGGWYRPYYYVAPPPPVVYVPPPAPAPVIIQQSAAPAAAPAAAATAASSPTIRSNTLPISTRSVQLRNPRNSGGNVSFVVDGKTEVNLAPGDLKPLGSNNTYLVEFDRGGDFGTTRRELVEGTYEFVVTESGWDLQRLSTESTLRTTDPLVRRNTLPGTTR